MCADRVAIRVVSGRYRSGQARAPVWRRSASGSCVDPAIVKSSMCRSGSEAPHDACRNRGQAGDESYGEQRLMT
jgi:hypothetical protein